MDIKAKAEVAQILSNLVSEETLLKFLPKTIVDDVEKEIERKAAAVPTDLLGLTDGGAGGITPDAVAAADFSGIQIDSVNKILERVGMPLDEGGMTREAAISQLRILLGISRTDAIEMLGDKQTGPKTRGQVE